MAYEKNTWSDGDVITAEKLNHIEDGIANSGGSGGVVFVPYKASDGKGYFEKTWQELYDLVKSNAFAIGISQREITTPVIQQNVSFFLITAVLHLDATAQGGSNRYVVYAISAGSDSVVACEFTCSNADDYPEITLS